MVLIGGLMTFRRYLRGADDPYLRETGAANQPPFRQMDPINAFMQAPKNDSSAMRLGILFVITGTLVWGYGDLLLLAGGVFR